MQNYTNRRHFLRKAALSTGAMMSLPSIMANTTEKKGDNRSPNVDQSFVILFQGDSITDARRNRDVAEPNTPHGLGSGYVNFIATSMMGVKANEELQIYNKGISGNKVYQLAERWEEDCLALQPDVISILIGVNDYWHKYQGNYDGTVEVYETDYRKLLERTQEELPNVELVICEPFAVKGGTAVKDDWFPEFDGYRAVAKKMADEFEATFVPYHSIFEDLLENAPASYWCPDGVHPAPPGNYAMGQAWLRAYGG